MLGRLRGVLCSSALEPDDDLRSASSEGVGAVLGLVDVFERHDGLGEDGAIGGSLDRRWALRRRVVHPYHVALNARIP